MGTSIDMKFEIVVIPVSDVDRAKKFYANLGWTLEAARKEPAGRGVEVSETFHHAGVYEHAHGAAAGRTATLRSFGSVEAQPTEVSTPSRHRAYYRPS